LDDDDFDDDVVTAGFWIEYFVEYESIDR